MNLQKSPHIVIENIWQPLVHVPANHRAFLVHPGTTLKPQELATGWHWHWPLLTSIRQISGQKVTFHFAQSDRGTPYVDEPITAVSRDHHLFTAQGIIELSANVHASNETLAQLNRHTIKRIIRPLVRQSVRQAIAQFESDNITRDGVATQMLELAKPLFHQHGLSIHTGEFSQLEHYQPSVTS